MFCYFAWFRSETINERHSIVDSLATHNQVLCCFFKFIYATQPIFFHIVFYIQVLLSCNSTVLVPLCSSSLIQFVCYFDYYSNKFGVFAREYKLNVAVPLQTFLEISLLHLSIRLLVNNRELFATILLTLKFHFLNFTPFNITHKGARNRGQKGTKQVVNIPHFPLTTIARWCVPFVSCLRQTRKSCQGKNMEHSFASHSGRLDPLIANATTTPQYRGPLIRIKSTYCRAERSPAPD